MSMATRRRWQSARRSAPQRPLFCSTPGSGAAAAAQQRQRTAVSLRTRRRRLPPSRALALLRSVGALHRRTGETGRPGASMTAPVRGAGRQRGVLPLSLCQRSPMRSLWSAAYLLLSVSQPLRSVSSPMRRSASSPAPCHAQPAAPCRPQRRSQRPHQRRCFRVPMRVPGEWNLADLQDLDLDRDLYPARQRLRSVCQPKPCLPSPAQPSPIKL